MLPEKVKRPRARTKSRSIPFDMKLRIWACPCVVCGRQDDIEVDHVIAVVDGGGCDESNLQALCRVCNLLKLSLGSNSAAAAWIKSNREDFEFRQHRRTRRLALIAQKEWF